MHEGIRRAIVALDETEALGAVEELHRAFNALTRCHRGAFTRRTTFEVGATGARFARFARRTFFNRQRFAFDLQFGRRNAAIAFGEGEFQRLAIGQAGQASGFHRRDVHKHIFATVFTHHEAKALLRVEELHRAAAGADHDARGHFAPGCAAAEAAATATATAEAATAATAEAITAAAEAAATTTAAAEPVATAAEAAAGVFKTVKAAFALVRTTPGTTSPSIKTHLISKSVAVCLKLEPVGRCGEVFKATGR